jgi:hypothetical protein
MPLKLLLIALFYGLLSLSLFSSPLFAFGSQNSFLSFDFQVGFSASWQSDLLLENPVTIPSREGQETTFTGGLGGFVGLGTFFNTAFPFATGVEYTLLFVSQSSRFQDFFDPTTRVAGLNFSRKDNFLNQFLDVYYKATFSDTFPVNVQINLGFAIQNYLSVSSSFLYGAIDFHEKISVGDLSLGLHVGGRISLYLLFIGFDYSFIPSFYEENLAYEGMNINPHRFSLSLGLLLNQNFLNQF